MQNIPGVYHLSNKSDNFYNSNYCFTIILGNRYKKKRDKIKEMLSNYGIGTSVYYPHPVPLLKYYKNKYRYKYNEWPVAKQISDNSIAFPVGPHIEKKDILYICDKLSYLIKVL